MRFFLRACRRAATFHVNALAGRTPYKLPKESADCSAAGQPACAGLNLLSQLNAWALWRLVWLLLSSGLAQAQCFSNRTDYSAGSGPQSVAIGDVNGDGRPDIVTANRLGDNVAVLLGKASGGYSSAQFYAVGNRPYGVALGDVNADGRLDIVTANLNGNSVTVLLAQAAGGYAAQPYDVGDGPISVAVGDLNGDRRLDIVTADRRGNNVTVLLARATGGYAAQSYGVGGGPYSVAVGDVNADGRPDIVTANLDSDNVTILLAQAAGGYAPPQFYAVGDGPDGVVLGDVNADGRPDIVTSNVRSDNVTILLAQTAGGYAPPQSYAVGDGPYGVAVGDINADGRLDIVATLGNADNVTVLLAQASGGYASQSYAVGDNPYSMAVGDVNADGRPDIVTANFNTDNVTVLSSTPVAITRQPASGSSVCEGVTVTASVSANEATSTYQWYRNGNVVTGQTSATLTLTNVQPALAGSYSVVVTGSCSSVTSTAFSLTVTPLSPDYQPLVDLYNSTNGAGWIRKDNWLTGCTPCGWYGVACDGNGRVINLILENNNLNGTIPASLSALTNLQVLRLIVNSKLSGPIPASLSALSNLRELSLQDNQLSGNLPTTLGNLSNLSILNLGQNQLSGPVPGSLSALTKLQAGYFNNNQLSGCFPASLSAVCGKLQFGGNPGLPGGGDFGAFCTRGAGRDDTQSADYLALVDFYNTTNGPGWTRKDNWLTGCTPCGWYGVTCDGNGRVTSLDLTKNEVKGSIPASLSNLTSLKTVQLLNNQLSGSIPASLSKLTNLSFLGLGFNQLTGAIPPELSQLTSLTLLALDNNKLEGSIPASLSALTNLQALYLYNNQLNGSIPASLSVLTHLQNLYLQYNQLSGSIPASLSVLTNLQILYLNNNQLSGSIPASLSNLTNLKVLSLQDNQLSGNLPATLGNLVNLNILNLGQNQLSGPVPGSLSTLAKLQVGYFNNNQLSGCFPASLSALCGKVNFGGNAGLPGGGDFAAFCNSGAGSDAFRPLATVKPNPVCAGSPVSLSVSAGTFYQWSGPAGFTASTQTPGFTPASAASSGVYSVTAGNGSPTCTATASVSLTVNPLPTPAIAGLVSSICQEASPVTLTGTGSPSGGIFTIDGLTATTLNPAKLSVGQHTVVYSYTNTSGCSNTASQTVTIKATPLAPTIATQAGQPYPAGLSNLTIAQNVGDVVLTASGCPGGTITWAGGNATTLAVSTVNTGLQTFTATCQQNGCTSPIATATLTVVPTTLSVLHRDAGNGQLTTNTVQPYLILQNAGNTPIPYGQVTVRYWLTVENFVPLNFQVSYAPLGTDKVRMRYVALDQPRQGAFGYVEYSVDAAAGSLAALTNSGIIQNSFRKQDGSNLNQADDYSYVLNRDFSPNPRITAYVNGQIVWGQEPAGSTAMPALVARTQNNNGPASNAISTYLQLDNTGNTAVAYGDIRVRYYFTADGTQPLTLTQTGYQPLGPGNLMTRLVAVSPPLAGADTYVEFSFNAGLGSLSAGGSTGSLQYQLTKSDYSYFDQSNDYSYRGTSPLVANDHVVVYVGGLRVYGTEPGAGARQASPESADAPLRVRVLGNPVRGTAIELEVLGAEGQPLHIQMTDLSGRLVSERSVERAGVVERQTLPVGQQPAGLLLLRVSTPTQSQTVKVLKAE